MQLDYRSVLWLTTCLVFIPASPLRAAPPERTLSMDAIELIAGRETAGQPQWAVEHEGITYLFASPENQATFEKSRAKYEVTDGGACGKMGPLSGLGDARRFAVHGGRIFLFASDGCREGFLKDPARYIEADDEKPFGSHEQVLAGRATLDKLVTWAGGAERLKKIAAYRATAARKQMQGEKEWSVTNETAIMFPDRYFQKEAWNDSWYSTTGGPDGGAMASSRGQERIAESRRRAFNRAMARWPLALVKAHVDGAPKAECPGLVAIDDGEGTLDGTAVEYVKVWLNGAASRLTIDKASGKLLALSFRGRDTTSKVGESIRRYSEFATVDGVTLPMAYTVTFDGKTLEAAGAKIDAFEINPKLETSLFAVPGNTK